MYSRAGSGQGLFPGEVFSSAVSLRGRTVLGTRLEGFLSSAASVGADVSGTSKYGTCGQETQQVWHLWSSATPAAADSIMYPNGMPLRWLLLHVCLVCNGRH
jgi:hypothetical protein